METTVQITPGIPCRVLRPFEAPPAGSPSELKLPDRPADIPQGWGPPGNPAGAQLAWLLLWVLKQSGDWGAVDSAALVLHMLTDIARPPADKAGFTCFGSDDPDWEYELLMATVTDKTRQGYFRFTGAWIEPTQKLLDAVTG